MPLISPLHVAVRRGALANARLLVEMGCDPSATNYSGNSAIDEARPERYRIVASQVINVSINGMVLVASTGQAHSFYFCYW